MDWEGEPVISDSDRELVMRWSQPLIKWHELPTYGELKRLVTMAQMAIRVLDFVENNRLPPALVEP